MIDGNKGVGANFFDEDLFNVLFYMTNLHQPEVTNNRKVVEINGADGTNESIIDGKKVDGPDIATENLVAENLVRSDVEDGGKKDVEESVKLGTIAEDPVVDH